MWISKAIIFHLAVWNTAFQRARSRTKTSCNWPKKAALSRPSKNIYLNGLRNLKFNMRGMLRPIGLQTICDKQNFIVISPLEAVDVGNFKISLYICARGQASFAFALMHTKKHVWDTTTAWLFNFRIFPKIWISTSVSREFGFHESYRNFTFLWNFKFL